LSRRVTRYLDVEDAVDHGDGYLVVRKHQSVAKIAERTEPRRTDA
jgi:hypothetical protein